MGRRSTPEQLAEHRDLILSLLRLGAQTFLELDHELGKRSVGTGHLRRALAELTSAGRIRQRKVVRDYEWPNCHGTTIKSTRETTVYEIVPPSKRRSRP